MKISERDKKLLLILVAVAIVALAYFFGYKKFTEKTDKINAELANLEMRYKSLHTIALNEKKYVADTKANQEAYNEIMANYSNNVNQEALIMELREYEYDYDTLWIKVYSMPKPTKLHSFRGNKTIGYNTPMALTLEASYSDFKKLLEEIITGDKKKYIPSISLSYNEIDDKVTATLQYNRYTIVDLENPDNMDKVKLENVLIGHDNIFVSSLFKPGASAVEDEGNRVLNDNDLQVVVNPVGAGDATVSINQTGDRTGATTLKTDYNGTSDVSITIAEDEGGQYKATYKIGAEEKSIKFIPGANLDILVCSTPRIENDNVAIRLSIKNTTSMKLTVKVINDDEVSPRVIAPSIEGNVQVI